MEDFITEEVEFNNGVKIKVSYIPLPDDFKKDELEKLTSYSLFIMDMS